jgi:hypothetical protein
MEHPSDYLQTFVAPDWVLLLLKVEIWMKGFFLIESAPAFEGMSHPQLIRSLKYRRSAWRTAHHQERNRCISFNLETIRAVATALLFADWSNPPH